MAFFAANAKAQDIDSLFTYNPELAGSLDNYSRSNIYVANGKDVNDFHGSGDFNNNGIGMDDANAIDPANFRYQLDVDWDNDNDNDDKQIITDYVNGAREHLPGDWEHLSGLGKVDLVNKWKGIHVTNKLGTSGWYCGDYTPEACVATTGIMNPEQWTKYTSGKIDISDNGRYRLPFRWVGTNLLNPITGEDEIGVHFINGVLVGPRDSTKYAANPENLNHWYFFDPAIKFGNEYYEEESNGEVKPGDWNLSDFATIENFTSFNNYQSMIMARFNFPENDGNYTTLWGSAFENRTLREDPNKPDTGNPTFSIPENSEVRYNEYKTLGGDSLVRATLPTDVADDKDPNPIVEWTHTAGTIHAGRVDLNVDYSVTDAAGNKTPANWTISVLDGEAPTFTAPENFETTLEDFNENGLEGILAGRLPTDHNDNSGEWSSNLTSTTNRADDGFGYANFNGLYHLEDVDPSGNKTAVDFTGTIKDWTAPVFTYVPNDVEISSGESMDPADLGGFAEAIDNSGFTNVSYSDNVTDDNDLTRRTDRTWRAVDATGNAVGSVQGITENKPTGINDGLDADGGFSIGNPYPNPAIRVVKIPYDCNSCNSNAPAAVSLYSLEGKMINETQLDKPSSDGEVEYDLFNVPAGIYFVRAIGPNGKTFTKKIVKQ